MFKKTYILLTGLLLVIACNQTSSTGDDSDSQSMAVSNDVTEIGTDTMMITNLDHGGTTSFTQIQKAFAANNPGYQVHFLPSTKEISARNSQQVIFVQKGGGTATLSSGESSKISVGDIILMTPGQTATTDSLIDYLVFETPEPTDSEIPQFIRPDWDPNITDTPGGCATETNAYRRILLTWLGNVGPYLYKSLNAHRVRIMDSFTHYHPLRGGFDEFYLVQMALPDARIITSNQTDDIIDTEANLSKDQIGSLVQETPLHVGDLLYLPRGVTHRGIGGVLAQVITAPGFVPKAELGVDHHLKRINDQYDLQGEDALPFNKDAAGQVIIK